MSGSTVITENMSIKEIIQTKGPLAEQMINDFLYGDKAPLCSSATRLQIGPLAKFWGKSEELPDFLRQLNTL